ncbi:uncharacterized protein LOC112183781 [Rosa chinensis]|uniref:uncharacterized protein LOC112183781 n=1 Tax=Rosa chinensis TaxID=74649 RepID=UPI000D097663|nr:uncharacterized protein LOC112183781 [Rosa chinensis]
MNNSGLSLATIEPLNGHNFKKWRSDIELYLGNIDNCLTKEAPVITNASTAQDRVKFVKWIRANRMSLLIMKRLMSDAVKGSFPDKATAREYLDLIAEMFKENEKAETSILLNTLNNLKYTASVGIREHIMKFIDVATKLKDLDMPLQDQLIPL